MEVSATAQDQELAQPADVIGRQVIVSQRIRMAWLALGGAFVLFSLLCAGSVAGAFWYASHAPETHPASLELWHGSTLEIKRAGTTNYVIAQIATTCKDKA